MSLIEQSLRVGGVDRRYLLAVTAGQNPSPSIVLSLHGTRSTADGQARLSRFTRVAPTSVVVFPQAIAPVGRGYEWDHDRDLEFLHLLISELLARYGSADGRVGLTGMSGGARMSCRFAAAEPELVRMVGAVAGLRAPAAGAPLARPVPVLAFHGTSDRINPYAGSGTARWDESVPAAAERWAQANGLPPEPSDTAVGQSLTRRTYGPPGGPGEVTLWTVGGGGHTWPGTRLGLVLRLVLGKTTTEIDASAEIMAFAQTHSGAS
jgi:polyhydroxybutyrate depolymerase